jgi:hypothetical protein
MTDCLAISYLTQPQQFVRESAAEAESMRQTAKCTVQVNSRTVSQKKVILSEG